MGRKLLFISNLEPFKCRLSNVLEVYGHEQTIPTDGYISCGAVSKGERLTKIQHYQAFCSGDHNPGKSASLQENKINGRHRSRIQYVSAVQPKTRSTQEYVVVQYSLCDICLVSILFSSWKEPRLTRNLKDKWDCDQALDQFR
jgi:hypothetical protein